jgi:hypothetical protein
VNGSGRFWRRVGALLAAATALALLLPGCKPKAGDKCESSQDICEDPGTALACRAGVLDEAPCRGPAGCTKAGQTVTCDDSISVENEPCLEKSEKSDLDNRACTADKKESLLCQRGKWKGVERCGGPKGCAIRGDILTCDARGAAQDDPCPGPGTYSCATDSKSRLACKGGKFAFDRYCRGEAGCRDSDVSCDQSLSALGDPCGVPGMVACSPDGKNEMLCQGGHFAVQRDCPGGCQVAANRRIQCQ